MSKVFRRTPRKKPIIVRNFFPAPVFLPEDPFLESAQCRGLTPPLDPQAAALSIGGRAVPDYGAPFNLFGNVNLPGVDIFLSRLRSCVSRTPPTAICCTMVGTYG